MTEPLTPIQILAQEAPPVMPSRRDWEHEYRGGRWAHLSEEYCRYAAIADLLSPMASRVLDLGCGEARLFDVLRSRGFGGTYFGVDWSYTALSAARQRGVEHLVCSDIRDFQSPRAFDVVVMGDVLYYLEETSAVIDRALANLRRGGRLVLSVYLPDASRSPEWYSVVERLRRNLLAYRPAVRRCVVDEMTGREWLVFVIGAGEDESDGSPSPARQLSRGALAIDPEALERSLRLLRDPSCPAEGTIQIGPLDLAYVHPRSVATNLELLLRDRVYDIDDLATPSTIVDGGAWIGLSSLVFRHAFPSARILAFEPDTTLFRLLKRNLERNGAQTVEVFNSALASSEGVREFTSCGSDAGSLSASVSGSKQWVETECLSARVDDGLALLKLNVEGAEWEILRELGERLRRVDQVLLEYHGFSDLAQTLHLILAELDRYGFAYILSHFNDTNRSCVPPLRLERPYRYFILVFAKQLM